LKILEIDKKIEEVTVKVEDLNDLWTLYNVITKDDKVTSRTQRRVILKEGSKGERKTMHLKLNVESVAFHEFSNRLRVKGTILEGPEDFVSYGTYHTFNVEIGDILMITKEKWLNNELKRLKEASKFKVNFIMLIVAIETGLATIDLISNYSHNKITTIKTNIPGKRYEQVYRNKALEKFFLAINNVIEENYKSAQFDTLIICGPGNTRDKFIQFVREKFNPLYLSKTHSIHASSGLESAILEILKSKELTNLKEQVKVLQEAEKIEEILSLFSTEPDLIAIGFDEIAKAAKQGAVKELFCADVVIRGVSKEQKLIVEQIITDVERNGGIINILSSEHPTGQQIIDLGEIIAILRYRL
jgi:protein pelota